MELSFSYHPALIILAMLLAGGLTYWTYRRTVPQVTNRRRWLLIGLRFTALTLLLFLLAEPILRLIQNREQPPTVAVLADNSQSLAFKDENGLDLESTVRRTLDALSLDNLDGEVRLYAFDQTIQSVETLDSLRFDGARTDISAALTRIRDDLKDANLQGVVLISDGRYNTGRNPLYLAERFDVPIHTIVVGDTTQQQDVQIRRLTTNEVAYVNDELPVQIGLRSEGYEDQQATVTLFQDGVRQSSTVVTLPSGTSEIPIDLSYVPRDEGIQQLSVTVNRFDGEITYENNTATTSVRVLKRRQRVLLLAGAPSPDLASVRQVLAQDPNIETSTFTQQSSGTFYEGPLPTNFDDFDALVLVGYPGPQSDRALGERIATEVEEQQKPLLFLLGRQTNLNLVRTVFNDILPVSLRTPRTGFVEATFDLASAGRVHPVMTVADASENLWRMLPPLQYSESSWIPAPDAKTLASIQIRGIALDDPLLVLRSRSQTRTAALLGTGTWRWKNVPEDLEAIRTYWPDLLGNLLQWITTRDDDRPVRVRPVRDLFGDREAVEFSGQVYDESLNPVDGASIQVQVTAPNGDEFDYTMDALGNGRYFLNAGTLTEGTYRYEASATREGTTLGTDSGGFTIGTLTLEFRETTADGALMRQIARRSSGTFSMAEEAGSLSARISEAGSLSPLVIRQDREQELWRQYIFLIVIIVLLTLEWFLRKRSGMV